MIRERIGRAALRSYPPAARRTRGAEMLGMLLDAGEQSSWALARESGSLVLGGLRERGAITARAGTRRLIADSCCQAVMILLTLWIVSALKTQLIAGPSRRSLVQTVVLAAILMCALIGYERIAALSGLAALAAFGPVGQHTQLVLLTKVLVPVACLLVMVITPQRRPRDLRQLLWLLPVCVLAVLHAHVGPPEALALISLGGLLRLFHDPRLAVACSLAWMMLLMSHAGQLANVGPGSLANRALLTAGLMLAVSAGRMWFMRQTAPA